MKNKLIIATISMALAGCSSSSNNSPDATEDNSASIDNSLNSGSDNSSTGSSTADNGTIDTDENPAMEPIALEIIGQDLLVSLAGFQADQLSLSVRKLAVEIAAAGEPMPLPDATFKMLDGFGPELVVTETQVISYSCNMGGQMRHESGRLRDDVSTETSLRGDYDAYTFDACRHSSTGNVFAAGEYVLEGELIMNAADYGASRGSRSSHGSNWTVFSMQTPEDVGYELSGSIDSSAFSAANFGSGDSRTVELPVYRKTVANQTVESLQDTNLSLTRTIPNGGNDSGYQLDANGIVISTTTRDTSITISSNPPLSGRNQFAVGNFEPFTGQIRMVSTDAGELILSANPESQISTEPGALLVDLVAQPPDGTTIVLDAVPLIDIRSGEIANRCFLDDDVGDDCETTKLP